MDDRALVETLRSGDPKAPGLLFDRFHGVVFGLCLRMMRHRHDAEDVVQETFLRALGGIAANRCRTALGRRSKRPVAAESVEESVDHRPGLADPDDLAGELERALGRIRPDYRLVFVLFHEQGLPYEEIALVIDRPIGTVKTWLHRARAELADDLTRRGVQC
jgi:DNA-directed RNA polymerase specialized sigma24 family protein